jgi:hypothetical protein
MSLKSIPVDVTRIRFVAIDVANVFDYRDDGSRSDRQRTDADGRLVYRVNVLAIVEGEPGGETVAVRVSFDDEPNIAPLTPVKFQDLTAKPWTQGDRSGVALVASGIETEGSTNGRRKATDPFPAPAEGVAA